MRILRFQFLSTCFIAIDMYTFYTQLEFLTNSIKKKEIEK